MYCEFRYILGWLQSQIPSLEFEIINSIRVNLWLDLFYIPVLDWAGKYLCLGQFDSIGNQLTVDSYTTKAVPLKELLKELFSPSDQDNNNSTQLIEDLGVAAATCWLQEWLDPNKYTYPFMSESGAEYSWYGLSDDLKEALISFVAVNDISESSFASVTSQLQVFGRIGMTSAAAISDMARNVFLDLPTTNKEMSDKKTILFRYFPEELQITYIMCAVQEATDTRQSNANAMYIQSNSKQERCNMVKR